jgi:Fe-S-cluster-containing dehydrogenase component
MACKMGNKLPDDTWWQTVRTLGNGDGIDRPGGTWPNLHMSWMPIWSEKCTMCRGRTSRGEEPYCVYNCPTHALCYGDAKDPKSAVSKELARLRDNGFHVYERPVWEGGHKGIVYATNK